MKDADGAPYIVGTVLVIGDMVATAPAGLLAAAFN